ncbi:MAG: hypothetical protein IKK63_06335 [Clostridia bacterium]|nr:hypothetical protein [Clostridia bacterium]MBR3818213.1 hypothetical protein [Clostridia bacterium]
MFVVLKTVVPEKNCLKRRKQIKRIKNSPAAVYKTEMGLPFYILEIIEPKKESDFAKISGKCGRYASRIIASHSFPLPDNSGLKRFIPVSMNSFLIFNTALAAIGKASLPADKICITVTDRNAVVSSRICELLPYASTIRIITSHPERYALAVTEAYENHGASLVIRNNYEPVSQPEIVICCDGAVLSSMNNAAVFVAKRKTGGKVRFNGIGVRLSDYHQELIPDDIETVDFAGALTELCGSSEYKFSPFSEIEISCSNCENPVAEKCLKCCVCNQSVTNPKA